MHLSRPSNPIKQRLTHYPSNPKDRTHTTSPERSRTWRSARHQADARSGRYDTNLVAPCLRCCVLLSDVGLDWWCKREARNSTAINHLMTRYSRYSPLRAPWKFCGQALSPCPPRAGPGPGLLQVERKCQNSNSSLSEARDIQLRKLQPRPMISGLGLRLRDRILVSQRGDKWSLLRALCRHPSFHR